MFNFSFKSKVKQTIILKDEIPLVEILETDKHKLVRGVESYPDDKAKLLYECWKRDGKKLENLDDEY